MGSRMVVYTAKIGMPSNRIVPPEKTEDYDFVTIESQNPHNSRRRSRLFKMLPHLFFPKYDISLWVDSRYQFRLRNLQTLVDKYLKDADWATWEFGWGGVSKYWPMVWKLTKRLPKLEREIREQVYRYKSLGMPQFIPAYHCAFILRRHSRVRHIGDFWWREYNLGCERDQVSFPFIVWRTGMKITKIPVEEKGRSVKWVG